MLHVCNFIIISNHIFFTYPRKGRGMGIQTNDSHFIRHSPIKLPI
jgi:hypothetical protein